MFFGEFEYRLDEKGRFPIPPRFRTLLKDGLVFTRGIEHCITAYPLAEWKKLAQEVTGGSAISRQKQRRLNRALFSGAFLVHLDGQGRITLPPKLKEVAGISDEIIIAGANNYLELWNPEEWQAEQEIAQEQAWQIIESMENE
ncbi:MAG: division/cell wall cluster transcriptional repressor MraZ [Dehalococcoidales bacterium]|nr:division/cell wall cluster transcriptional repressor MraZ [Dehalococcoidales bacterium]MDD4230084.1 division/cell wall cluster transcriptional repressor MraZ [Dehalococcoidales bacterium]MDD4465298.1 division/cell wall cluster transcriptional repressor MraZ [Dehalococcoidales bacterium]MDD5402160.1 division/cell wall cluster transcriptional repressor MraZ [Dehalococcoidales bacterium]